MGESPVYRLRDIAYAYPGPSGVEPQAALQGVSLDIRRGEIVAVAGPNASGKTTLGLLLAGIIRPVGGEIAYGGGAPQAHDHPYPGVAMLFQNPENTFVAPTLEEDVAFGPENSGADAAAIREIVDRCLDRVGLSSYALAHPATLSGGQQQLAALAGALTCSPDVLIMDEATGYLDAPHRRLVLDLVMEASRSQGMTVVMITQEAAEMWLAGRLLVMKEGTPAYLGAAAEVLGRPDECRRLGIEVDPLAELGEALAARGFAAPQGRPTVGLWEEWLVRPG